MSEPLAPSLETVEPMSAWTRVTPPTQIGGYGDDAYGVGIYSPTDPTRFLWTRVNQALSLFLLALAIPFNAKASDSFTPSLVLTLPAVGVVDPNTPWGTKLNNNFSIIDSAVCDKRAGCTIQGPLVVNGTLSASAGGLSLSTMAVSTITVSQQAQFGSVPGSTFTSSGYLVLGSSLTDNGPATFVSTVTIIGQNGGSALLVTYGVTAGSVTVAQGLTASSGTFLGTGAGQFSIATSSGISMTAGTLNVSGGNIVAANTVYHQASGNSTYSLVTSSGVNVLAGTLNVSGGNAQFANPAYAQASGNSTYSLVTSSGINVLAGTINSAGQVQAAASGNPIYSIVTTSGASVGGPAVVAGTIQGTNSGNSVYSLVTSSGINISGTALFAGPAQFTNSGASAYSIITSSGIRLQGGGIELGSGFAHGVFYGNGVGAFVGDGSLLTGIGGALSGLTKGYLMYATASNTAGTSNNLSVSASSMTNQAAGIIENDGTIISVASGTIIVATNTVTLSTGTGGANSFASVIYINPAAPCHGADCIIASTYTGTTQQWVFGGLSSTWTYHFRWFGLPATDNTNLIIQFGVGTTCDSNTSVYLQQGQSVKMGGSSQWSNTTNGYFLLNAQAKVGASPVDVKGDFNIAYNDGAKAAINTQSRYEDVNSNYWSETGGGTYLAGAGGGATTLICFRLLSSNTGNMPGRIILWGTPP